jgi:hypothetical protein
MSNTLKYIKIINAQKATALFFLKHKQTIKLTSLPFYKR